nr:glycosyltransferase N-terminal domain-containing protein [Winogradskyella wandonensis]
MKFFYSLGIYLLGLVLKLLSLFNEKIRLGVKGREKTFKKLEESIAKTDKTIWMHAASLGEYEQGLPVLQALKSKYPERKIIVSFFSPSGYEIKKNATEIDVAVYLPLDTPKNARRFLNLVHPDLILFVKYEIWPNILIEAQNRQIKSILFSATFRKNQSYFKWYGGFMRNALFTFEHIFTQDLASKQLIESIGCKSVSAAGDTRFDRVSKQLKMDNSIDFIQAFKAEKTTIVFGSSWPADDALFIPFINQNHVDLKFVIAPHNIKPGYIDAIVEQLNVAVVKFSEMAGKILSDYNVLILDTIGYLSKSYAYADIAYVGGAAGKTGLHNILEPAVFGVPIIIGKNHNKFPEASRLIELGGVISVSDNQNFSSYISTLINDKAKREKLGAVNSTYIKNNQGAVVHIMDYIRI